MTEAWEQRYQIVKIHATVKELSFMQAAARLGVGVFASAALKEGVLLQDTSLEVRYSVSSIHKLPLNPPSSPACPSHTIMHNTQPVLCSVWPGVVHVVLMSTLSILCSRASL